MAGPAWAGEAVLYGPAPKWVDLRASGAIETRSATPLALLDVQHRIEGETLTAYVDQAIKFASPEALTQGGTSTAAWLPDKGDLTVHRVEILRGGKVIDLLGGGARYEVLRRETGLERRQLDGQLTATLAIPGLQLGDVLRIAYSQTTRDKALQGKVQIDTPLLTLPVEAGFARTMVSWPEGAPVKWQAGPAVTGAAETVKQGWHVVTLQMPLPKRDEMPAAAPSRFVRSPSLEVTNFASWEEVSRVFAPLYATGEALPKGSPLAGEVDRIAAASADPLTRAAFATRLVQDKISYLMNGMSGGNYVPQAPAQTWEARFGDCKAKSLLLLTLLRALGIEAEVIAVNSRTGDAVPESLPMPAAFDHVIVRAMIGGVPYWLDGTATGTRASNIAETPPFRFGLPIRADGAALTAIEPRAPASAVMVARMEIDQRAGIDIPALVTATSTISGMMASNLGAAVQQASAEQKKQMIDSFAGSIFKQLSSNGVLVTDGDMQFEPETGLAQIMVKGIVTSQFSNRDGAKRLDLSAMSSANITVDFDRSRAAWRAVPVDLGGARRLREEFAVLLPEDEPGFRLGGKPDYEATFAGTTITRKGALDGSRLTVSEEQIALGGELASADLPAEKAKAMRLRNTVPFLTSPLGAARSWRYGTPRLKARLAPVEAAYARAIAREPAAEQTTALLARAHFRAGTYDLEGAIADYDKAIALSPDAETYFRRGAVKKELGRTDAAIADYREAFALAPGVNTAMPLADLLGAAGKSEEALRLLTEYDDMGDEHVGVVQVRADVLALAGKREEGLKEIAALIEEKPGDTSLLNASCWFRARFRVGMDGMIEVCNQAVERAANPGAVLDSRAMAWIAAGNMANALADAEAAVKLYPGQVPTHYLRAVAAAALGRPEAGADLAYFRKVMPGMVQEYARYGIKP